MTQRNEDQLKAQLATTVSGNAESLLTAVPRVYSYFASTSALTTLGVRATAHAVMSGRADVVARLFYRYATTQSTHQIGWGSEIRKRGLHRIGCTRCHIRTEPGIACHSTLRYLPSWERKFIHAATLRRSLQISRLSLGVTWLPPSRDATRPANIHRDTADWRSSTWAISRVKVIHGRLAELQVCQHSEAIIHMVQIVRRGTRDQPGVVQEFERQLVLACQRALTAVPTKPVPADRSQTRL
jgi:hypothetical protein